MQPRPLRLGDVFVAGGLPTITYNPRAGLALEEEVRDYLDEGHRILSVSGPTKTGKTVLVRSILPPGDAIWLSGGSISSIAEFWDTIAEHLGLFTGLERSSDSKDEVWNTRQGQLGVGVAKGAIEAKEVVGAGQGQKMSRSRNVATQVREALRGSLSPLVIDDFHYVSSAVQVEIVRGIKDLVFDGLRVVVVAVPHRAYDVVRVEREMTGRVQQIKVGFWSAQDLSGIAEKGFAALNLEDEGDRLSKRLSIESFESPHLMQYFCLQLCKANGFREVQAVRQALVEPGWDDFFRSQAAMTSKSAFDLLARGPRQRTDRKERTLKSGEVTDIYGAVLAAIARTGPRTSLSYEEIRSGLREVLASELPQRQQVTRVLEEMSKIAENEIAGEPVVDFDSELATLYISDPYFAFYLRWGLPDQP